MGKFVGVLIVLVACTKSSGDTDAVCGDGVLTPGANGTGETCDDGNTVSNDGCSSTCQKETCGDHIVQTNEQCDGGSDCGSDCKLVVTATPHTLTASWTFLTAGAAVNCPAGAVNTTIVLTPIDSMGNAGTPLAAIDAGSCANGHFTTAQEPGSNYSAVVKFGSGATAYASSLPAIVDLRSADATASFTLHTDAGYLHWKWQMIDDANHVYSCSDAGAGVDGIVGVTITPTTDVGVADKCAVGETTTQALTPGTYDVTFYLTDNDPMTHIAESDTQTITINTANAVTDLGLVSLRIDGI